MGLSKEEKIYRLEESANNLRNALYNLDLARDNLKTNFTFNNNGFKYSEISDVIDNLYWYISELENKIIPAAKGMDGLDDKF